MRSKNRGPWAMAMTPDWLLDPSTRASTPGLRVVTRVAPGTFRLDGRPGGTVVLRCEGTEPLHFATTPPFESYLLDPARPLERCIAATFYVGDLRGMPTVRLVRKQEQAFPFFRPTQVVSDDGMERRPAGDYELVVPVWVIDDPVRRPAEGKWALPASVRITIR